MTPREQALIETVRVIGGCAPLWELHCHRVAISSRKLGLTVAPLPEPASGADRVVRYQSSGSEWIETERTADVVAPFRLATASVTHGGYPDKLADRDWLDAARTEVLGRADDAVLCNANGVVVEASRWAIGWWDDDGLVFPPLWLGGLPSVARARLGEAGAGAGEARVAVLDISSLCRRAVVVCNAARGVVPVASIDDVALPTDPRTVTVIAEFWNRPGA